MKKLRFWLATIAVLLCSVSVSAYDFEVDGIYYNITSETNLTVEVTHRGLFFDPTYSDYTGEVVIPESVTYNGKTYSVTSIRKQTFNECSGLTGVTIPNSVTSIGSSAFYNCSGLTSVTIPNSVTSIGYEAFYGCSGLTSVYITDLKAWCRIVFDGYYSNPLFYTNHLYLNGEEIKDLVIPNSVTSIGSSAFYNCSGLTSVYITDLKAWCKIVFDGYYSNPLFYTNHLYLNGEEIKDLVIPNSVTSIGNYAFFHCFGLTSITIPNSVTSIGDATFYGCKSLKTVINLSNLNLTKESSDHGYVAYYASRVIKADGTVGDYIFTKNGQVYALVHYAGNDKELTLPENYKGNNYKIANDMFSGRSELTSITIPNSVTSIGSYAFSDCSGLTSITIPNSVTSIGSYAFKNCTSLTAVHITDMKAWCELWTDNYIHYASDNPLYYAKHLYLNGEEIKDLVIPYSVTKIGDNVFYNCQSLTSVTIPNSVTSIGVSAFSGCSGLTSVTIPNSVTSIGVGAFSDCSNLTAVHITDLKAWCDITFKIDSYFDHIHYSNPLYYAKHLYLNGEEIKDLVIPNSVTSIRNYAFSGCSGLTSVTIPSSVTSIGYDAFYSCSGLTSVTIGNSVTSIEDYAFYGCSNLKIVINFSDLEFSKGSKYDGYVGYYADKIINADEQVGDFFFRTDTDGYRYLSGYIGNDTDLTLPNDYKGMDYKIGSSVFSGCSGLTSITIPNSVTSIGSSAFGGCKGLTSVTIPNSVTSIGNNVFYNCSGLTSITIPNSVTSIGNKAFYGCNQLNKLIIEDGSMSIFLNDEQFIDCPLEYVYIGRDHSYQNKPFKEGKTLKTAVIGPKVRRIGNHLFSGCSGLTSVTIPNSVTTIGDEAFRICHNLTNIAIPNSVTSIGEKAFYNCNGFTSITIPNSVTSIGNGAFEVCSSLKELYIGNSVTSIPNRLLSNCYALKKLYIGSSVTSIGDNLLTNCTNLNTLSVGAKIPPTVNDLGLGSQQYFTVKLQVPEGSKAMYQFAEAWKKFFNIEEFDPATGIAEVTPDAEEKNLPIYNLQGTRMTEEKENLPTGIYIQGGKKIVVK